MKWVRVKSEEKEGEYGGIGGMKQQLEKGNDLLDQICKKNRDFLNEGFFLPTCSTDI